MSLHLIRDDDHNDTWNVNYPPTAGVRGVWKPVVLKTAI
jgi:hypothetical protein